MIINLYKYLINKNFKITIIISLFFFSIGMSAEGIDKKVEINEFCKRIETEIKLEKTPPIYDEYPKIFFYTNRDRTLKAIKIIMEKRMNYGLGEASFDKDENYTTEYYFFYKDGKLIKEKVVHKSIESSKIVEFYSLYIDEKVIFYNDLYQSYFNHYELEELFKSLRK